MRREPPAARRHPSEFARRVAEQVPHEAVVVDVGCGNGTDALWFADRGHKVIGVDYAQPGVRRARRTARQRGLDADFWNVSLYDVRATLATGARLAGRPEDLVVYARHLLDVLEPEGRTNFWLLVRAALQGGGCLFVRFRTKDRKATVREPGFRTLDPEVVEAEASARGARVVSREDQHGATEIVLAWS